MSTPTPWRSASPNTASRWATGSRSKAHGSIPPTRSAPAPTAAPRRSAVPGSRRIPACGNATISTRQRPAWASRAASTPSSRSSPLSLSTWTWLRTSVAPDGDRRPERPASPAWPRPRPPTRQLTRSFSTSPASPGSAVCGRNGRPRRVESRWAWTSARAGSSTLPRTVDDRHARVGAHAVGADRGDATVADQDVDGVAAGLARPRPHSLQQQVAHIVERRRQRVGRRPAPGGRRRRRRRCA